MEIEEKGENIAVKEMRKHISAYTKSMPDSSSFRSIINTLNAQKEVETALKEYFAQQERLLFGQSIDYKKVDIF